MLIPSNIFIELKPSTLVSNLYGLMKCILYLIFIAPYCNVTIPLVNTLSYYKWALVWRFIFVLSAIIEHDFYLRLLSLHLQLLQSLSALLLFLWITF